MVTSTASYITPTSTQKIPPTKSHTSIDITTAIPTKTIRIERDYSKGDGITKFCTDFPNSLHGKITPEQFQHTITTINDLLYSAEQLSWPGALYNTLEILTIYLLPIFVSSHYHKTIHRILEVIDKENLQVYKDHQLLIGNPVKTAFLFIEIKVFE